MSPYLNNNKICQTLLILKSKFDILGFFSSAHIMVAAVECRQTHLFIQGFCGKRFFFSL